MFKGRVSVDAGRSKVAGLESIVYSPCKFSAVHFFIWGLVGNCAEFGRTSGDSNPFA
jgi:hypothetical protein